MPGGPEPRHGDDLRPARRPADDGAIAGVVERRRSVVEAELSAAVGGASLCSISKKAGSVPTAKYLEGRLAVLSLLRRAVRSASDVGATLDELRAEWQAELDRVVGDDYGPDWRAYRAGGVDELDELAAAR